MAGGDRKNADTALVVAVAAGLTNKQAAEQAGISESTVYRRLRDPAFKQQVRETRAATVEQASARLTAASLTAIQTLLQLLDAESESVRLGSARVILELGVKFREAQELEARISQLEQQLANQPQGGKRWAS